MGHATRTALTLLVLVAGCDFATAPQALLDLDVTLSSPRLHQDTGLVVTITATNRTIRTITLPTVGGCLTAIDVRGPDGTHPPRTSGFGCRSILVTYTLHPGERLEREYELRVSVARDGQRWLPGPHTLMVSLLDSDLKPVRDAGPFEFEVVCRDPSWTRC